MDPADYDAYDMRELYDLAYDFELGEWVGADLIDPDTGERYADDAGLDEGGVAA